MAAAYFSYGFGMLLTAALRAAVRNSARISSPPAQHAPLWYNSS